MVKDLQKHYDMTENNRIKKEMKFVWNCYQIMKFLNKHGSLEVFFLINRWKMFQDKNEQKKIQEKGLSNYIENARRSYIRCISKFSKKNSNCNNFIKIQITKTL